MAEFGTEILPVVIEDELKKLYLRYRMSVVVERVMADVREDERNVRVARIAEPADGATIEAEHVASAANERGVE